MLLTDTLQPQGWSDAIQCDLTTPLTRHPRLLRLLRHLESHPARQLTTASAAKLICLQKNYFCAFFKRETGYTFSNWQRAWRVTKIAAVLLAENISISGTAERYGYFNMRTFERAFRTHFNMSAREYRQRHGWRQPPSRRTR